MVSAYIKFSQAKRSEIQQANPGAGFGELGKLIGAAWRGLSDAEKASYGGSSSQGKTRKTRKNKGGHHMRRTNETHKGLPVYTEENRMFPNKNVRKAGKKHSTRKANPYANFVKSHWNQAKAQNPGASLGEISKQIAAMWKAQK